jgi:hypothetical protein
VLRYCQYVIGFLIGTNIYIAFISTALAFSGFLVFNKQHIIVPCLFVFFATQTAYNLQRFFKWRKNIIHPFLLPYTPKTIVSWIILIGIGSPVLLYGLFYISLDQIALLSFVVCITGAYIFVNPFSKKLTGLRYVPFLKTFLVAFSWTALFFILTFPEQPFEMLQLTKMYWLIVFLEILKACILFDLRDVEADKDEVKTFANTLKLKGVFLLWLLLSVLILMFMFTKTNYLQLIFPFMAVAAIQLYCIFKKPGALMFTFFVDGSLLLSALLNYLAFTNA